MANPVKRGTKKRDGQLIEKRIKRDLPMGRRFQDAIKANGVEDGGYSECSEDQILDAINEAKLNDWDNYSR